ncbi:unnamed protein product, partial [Laminaria digitata]
VAAGLASQARSLCQFFVPPAPPRPICFSWVMLRPTTSRPAAPFSSRIRACLVRHGNYNCEPGDRPTGLDPSFFKPSGTYVWLRWVAASREIAEVDTELKNAARGGRTYHNICLGDM